jgi:molecular chaperone DnaK (HSP70)
MRLGIDFGTTRTRVAAAIRGNYPLITFQAGREDALDWYPSLMATCGDRIAFGLRAQAVQYDPEWSLFRSFKRLLDDSHQDATWTVGSVELPMIEWLTRFLVALRLDLVHRSSLEIGSRDRLEVMLGIPAHANSNQRFLTLEAFRRAGFDVMGMLNEPSAAGIEYAHRYRRVDLSRRREHVAVYDLGGGTFDAAVICMAENRHDVVASEGISRLGGDDFDAALLELALADTKIESRVPAGPPARLLTLCREAKEAITPNSRKIVVDFGQVDPSLGEVMVPVTEFYKRCEPLILQTLQATEAAMAAALGRADSEASGLGVVYLVGGSCELPVLARVLRDRFGKRVRRSPYPSGATAIGLAIAADHESGYVLSDRFHRHFGVWREGEGGQRIVFDPIFTKETRLPRPGEPALVVGRRYRPAHNIGRFRYLECSVLREQGEPAGDILAWQEILFPYTPDLVTHRDLASVRIQRDPAVASHDVEEVYRCDAAGVVEVTIADQTTGHARTFRVREAGEAVGSPAGRNGRTARGK